jgi:hypothetical protein
VEEEEREMFANFKHHLRYWGFLLLKFAGAAAGSGFALWFLNLFWAPHTRLFHLATREFTFDLLYTFLAGIWFQFSFGLFYLAIWDQRYRCRTCLRRLRMPVSAGSWPNMMLFGQPRTEYICLYGHGTLKVPEVRITTKSSDWERHGDDIWKELESLEETKR